MDALPDAGAALGDIMESFVLTYRHDAATRTVLLVTDYPFTSPGSIREFVAFVFDDASFERLPGDHAPYQSVTDAYQGKGPGGMVVQHIGRRSAGPGRERVELWFGPNFGGIAITYGALRGYSRGSTATQTGPASWQYRDSKTDETFDFPYPFPSLTDGPPYTLVI
ncbi:hypothetical protein AB0J74_07380 [Asanoa sp. NPDC049573]|uniref:hypothetical protein n=1 Tax=Asanoa sp. NPDC049573 TaxID=3155396 RepID=UPI0034460A28